MYSYLLLIFAYVGRIINLKIGDPNVCAKQVKISNLSVTQKELDIECCPNYIYQNRKCEACPSGKFGQDCLLPCLTNYYGVQCKHMCNCTGNTTCDPINGCVCFEGFTGKHCTDACSSGRYGVNCGKECFCAQNAKCDPVTGMCLCPAGWFGNHCTKECKSGKFGKDCNETCDCSDEETCDVKTGQCSERVNLNADPEINESKSTVTIYIMMAAAVIGLVCVVTMILKAKEALCRMVQKQKSDSTKLKIKRRKDHRRPSNHNENSQTVSFTAETEMSALEPSFEEDLYCEIQDTNATEPVGINAKMSLRSFSQN